MLRVWSNPLSRAIVLRHGCDVTALRAGLAANPELVSARSVSGHHATLLHYVSANGIESELQFAVPNVLVSSDHPTEAGVAGSPLATALYSGTFDCVDVLIARGARTDNPVFAAAAGRADWLQSWFDDNGSIAGYPLPANFALSFDRAVAAEQVLVFASMCGQIVRLLLDREVNVNADLPGGSHWTATPLHTAAIQGQTAVVQLLLQRGADPTSRDSRYQSTPIDRLSYAGGPRRALARR